jgi:cellulose synthase (UDP-forming)
MAFPKISFNPLKIFSFVGDKIRHVLHKAENPQVRYDRPKTLQEEQTKWHRLLEKQIDKFVELPVFIHPVWSQVLKWFAIILFFLVATLPTTREEQAFYAVAVLALVMWIRKLSGRWVVLAMMTISVMTSTRYLYWRFSSTIQFDAWVDVVPVICLLIAECYAYIVLLLGFWQTSWPLKRVPAPLPEDTNDWPDVDVIVPSYNEPLSVVGATCLAAKAMDWPRDKLHIYVLDDGKRPLFRDFCEKARIGYKIRKINNHAKAGNINAALKTMYSGYVAIFDCDHLPTRSFLQITIGWFLKDEKLAMLQTPHYFFNPDPFERNLRTHLVVPNEGELFYGLLQDGNDTWNATFFCGSCAVIRRDRLLQVGGIAVETVTEDAHTALKLNRLGYTTAYLTIPQAAGLATETLSGHVGQRIRWARGMAQIFRVDNPLLMKGLAVGQRICYTGAMLHFFYGFPRLVFLTAPLTYLFFGAHIIHAEALEIACYAIPHVSLANITNSQVQGRYRYSFWAEVYETVLAWYILLPTSIAVINPALGEFNVTPKGGLIDKAYFDWLISKPYLVLITLNTLGLLFGFIRFFWWNADEPNTVLMNLFWVVYSLLILGVSVLCASESRQVRVAHRVRSEIPATLKFPNGKTIATHTLDFSSSGLGLEIPPELEVPMFTVIQVSVFRGREEFTFACQAVFRGGNRVGVRLEQLDMFRQTEFFKATFARADVWSRIWGELPHDRPMDQLVIIFKMGIVGLLRFYNHSMTDLRDFVRDFLVKFNQKRAEKALEKEEAKERAKNAEPVPTKHRIKAFVGKITDFCHRHSIRFIFSHPK